MVNHNTCHFRDEHCGVEGQLHGSLTLFALGQACHPLVLLFPHYQRLFPFSPPHSFRLPQLLLYWLGTSWKVKFFYAFLLTSGASVETRAQFSRGSCCVPPTHQTPIFSHILSTQQRSGLGQIFLENTFTERGFNLGLKLGIMCTFWDYMHFPERGSRYSPHSQRLPNKQTNK